jgi:hypothetical protein
VRKPLTLSVSKIRYNVIHEISQGVRYKPAKSESYSPIRWFRRSEDGHPSCKAAPDIVRCPKITSPKHPRRLVAVHCTSFNCTVYYLKVGPHKKYGHTYSRVQPVISWRSGYEPQSSRTIITQSDEVTAPYLKRAGYKLTENTKERIMT